LAHPARPLAIRHAAIVVDLTKVVKVCARANDASRVNRMTRRLAPRCSMAQCGLVPIGLGGPPYVDACVAASDHDDRGPPGPARRRLSPRAARRGACRDSGSSATAPARGRSLVLPRE